MVDLAPANVPSLSLVARLRAAGGEWGLLALCLFAFFWHLGSVTLFDMDEGLYISCAKQMALSGDLVTPRLNSRPSYQPNQTTVPFFEKPIFIYWTAAASLCAFGISEWAARLPAALVALLATGIVTLVGRRWFGRRAGLLAGVVYATAPMTIVDARQMTTDGLLVLWFTLALLAYWNCRQAPLAAVAGGEDQNESPQQSLLQSKIQNPKSKIGLRRAVSAWRWPLLFWVACALAVLTKGAVGLLLPCLVIGVFGLIERWGPRVRRADNWLASLRALRPAAGIVLFLALTVPWHILIWRAGGHDAEGRTWVQEYLIRQHIGRFKGLDTVHNAPLPTYFVYFLLGFFPWACFTPVAFRFAPGASASGGARPETEERDLQESLRQRPASSRAAPGFALRTHVPLAQEEEHRFLLVWFWTIFVFFSLGAAKLPTYIVPAYPAAALLVGRWLDRALATTATAQSAMARFLRWGAVAATVTTALLVAAVVALPHFAPAGSPVPTGIVRGALHLTLTLFLGSALATVCFLRGQSAARWRQAGIGVLAAMMLVVTGIAGTEGYSLAEREALAPYQRLAAAARPDALAGMPVVYYHIIPRRPSMLYYAGYSPLERGEAPLLPTLRADLRRYRQASPPEADVITSRADYTKLLLPELNAVGGVSARILAQTGTGKAGWVLSRLTFQTKAAPPVHSARRAVGRRPPRDGSFTARHRR